MCIMLGCLVKELLSQPIWAKTIKSRISLFGCENLSLSFTLDLVVFYLLYSSILSINWCISYADFIVRDFLRSEFMGSPTLKVQTATSLKSPSISLKSSQYLSEYVFKDFPSLVATESKESKGLGTLLHVTNLAPNIFVNSSYDLIDPSSSPLNHLMAVGPRLDGKT